MLGGAHAGASRGASSSTATVAGVAVQPPAGPDSSDSEASCTVPISEQAEHFADVLRSWHPRIMQPFPQHGDSSDRIAEQMRVEAFLSFLERVGNVFTSRLDL
eukprot:12468122-Alexandrium_andersonii.AAC.1